MPDRLPAEQKELIHTSSLLSLERKSFNNLPETLTISNSHLLSAFNEIRQKTSETGNEWGGFLVKNRGDLSIIEVHEGGKKGIQLADVEDWTGLSPEQYITRLANTIKKEKWRDEFRKDKFFSQFASHLFIFGSDLPINAQLKFPPTIPYIANTGFFGFVHSHKENIPPSPGDFDNTVLQKKRPDGKPTSTVSIIVGPQNIFLIAVPIDGLITQPQTWEWNDKVNWRIHNGLETKKQSAMNALPDLEKNPTEYADLLEKILKEAATERMFGLYKGDFSTLTLKKIN